MKKISAVLLSLLMLSSISAFAEETSKIVVTVDGEQLAFTEQEPVIVDGRTLVPLRTIFEALDAKVEWIDETKTVFARKRLTTISLQIGSNELYVGGDKIELDVPAQLINNKTMVPVRAISESFDSKVDWSPSSKVVTITSKQGDHKIEDVNLYKEFLDDNQEKLMHLEYIYPVIENSEKLETIDNLNTELKTNAEQFMNNEEILENVQYAKEDAQLRGFSVPYYFEHSFDITYDKNNIISLLDAVYTFTGGAHPNSLKSASNYDLVTGEKLKLSDILNMTEEEAYKMVEESFTTLINEEPEMYFEDAKETLKEAVKGVNYYLTDDGITFFLHPYEIAPYAGGYPEFSLSYEGSEHLFKIKI